MNLTKLLTKSVHQLTFPSRCLFRCKSKSSVGLLGVPFDKGQGKSGVALGPDAIRNGGLVKELLEFNGSYHPILKVLDILKF